MRTYRLTITQTDLSDVRLVDTAAGFASFTTIQALRGKAKPLFIPRGNEAFIVEQFGPPRDTNADVQEVIDFNREHDIWVSAPAGIETNDRKNRHGAIFVAEDGVYEGQITQAEAESTTRVRDAIFRTPIASTPGTPAIGLESDGTSSSQYIEFNINGSADSPLKLDGSSEFTVLLKGPDGQEVFVRSAATDLTWTDKDTTPVTDAIPTDSLVAVEDNWLHVFDNLDEGWFDANPGKLRYLRSVASNGTTGPINGYAYLVEDPHSSQLVGTVRLYTAIYDGVDLNAIYGTEPSDPMTPSNDFYASFTETSASKKRVSLAYTAKIEAAAMLFQKFATETKTDISFSLPPRKQPSDNLVRIGVADKPARNITIAERFYDVSFDRDATDDYNASTFAEDIINDRVIEVLVLGNEDDPATKIEDISPFSTEGFGVTKTAVGQRSIVHAADEADIASAMAVGWEEAKAAEFDQIALFFAPKWLPGMDSQMLDIRGTHRFSRCVLPVLPGTTATGLDTVADERNALAMHHGLAYVFNEIRTRDARTDTAWWRFPVGAYSSMLVRIMKTKNGAWAPMFLNDSGNVGGQINAAFEDIRIKVITPQQQREIDEAGINTMIYDPDFGLIMVNQRTGQNPTTVNDASWLVHDMAFDLFKRFVYRNIQLPQIGKPIDPQYIGLRTRQLQSLAGRFSNAFSDVRVEVESLNTDATRSQRRFQMATSVKVTPVSEFVDFNFYNVGQEASVDDPFEDS